GIAGSRPTDPRARYRSPVAGSFEEFEELRRSCIEDGLLTRTFGGRLRITKKGQELVKRAAILDEEVAWGVQEALRTSWLDRRSALVSLVLTARLRMGARDP